LGVLNSATRNTKVQTSLGNTDFVSIGCAPRSGIAVSYASLLLNFLETFMLFSIMALPVFIPTGKCCLFSTSSPALVTSCLFHKSHLKKCGVIAHDGLISSSVEHLSYTCWVIGLCLENCLFRFALVCILSSPPKAPMLKACLQSGAMGKLRNI
jgi:hypothetical protein